MKSHVLLALLFAASPAFAQDGAKTIERSLQQEIDLALKDGKDDVIHAPMAEKFGFGRADQAARKLRYSRASTPDKHEHSFVVVTTAGETSKPLALELSNGTAQIVDGKLVVDTLYFIASLRGTLKKAFRNHGIPGEIVPKELSVNSSDVQKSFKAEMNFHLHQVVTLGLKPAQ